MPGVGAIYRYFGALSVSCKLLKKSNLQFLPQESRKLFTVFSQNWMAEIHTVARTKQARSRRPNFAALRHGSSIGCCVSNARPAGHYSTRVTHSHMSVASFQFPRTCGKGEQRRLSAWSISLR